MKEEICFMSLSTEPSEPVLRSVVMARVAIDLVWTVFGGVLLMIGDFWELAVIP